MTKYFFLPIMGIALYLLACNKEPQGPNKADVATLDSLRQAPGVVLESLNKQIAEEPDNYGLFQDRSELYYALDSLDLAISDINKALQMYQNGPDLHYWKGFLSFVNDDTTAARISFEKAIGLGSQNPEVYYQLGQLYFFQGRTDAAQYYYQQASKYGPKDPQYLFAQGFLEENRQDASQAIKFYLQSLELDSAFAKSLLQLHDLYINYHSNEREARTYNQQLLRNNLGHPLANYNEANYQYRRAKRAQSGGETETFANALNTSILHYTIAIDNDADFALAHYARGMAFLEGGQKINLAIQDFQKTIELDPTYAQAHFMLGSVFEANRDLKTALEHYKEAYRLKPDGQGFKKAVEEVSAQLK